MRPKNKKHNFSRTDNKKYQEQNHKKEKTNNNKTIIVAIFIAFASTIQFSHNTPPHTQHPTKGLAYQGWSIEQHSCCSRHPTACHTTKQTRTQTHSSLFHWSQTTHMKCVRYLSSPENKNLPPPGANQHPHSDKTNTLFSLERRWSSRTFRYGYLVTTSPQSLVSP